MTAGTAAGFRGDGNPYVGPRAFQYGERIYGRTREVLDLLDLVIAERITLLHSPSGAGKTSLVQAGLIPRLEGEGFRVLPPTRVGLAWRMERDDERTQAMVGVVRGRTGRSSRGDRRRPCQNVAPARTSELTLHLNPAKCRALVR